MSSDGIVVEPLTQAQVDEALASLEGWSGDTGSIQKEYRFADFRQAVAFIVGIAFEAERRNHHPELQNVYNRVHLTLRTHDAGDRVTGKDVDLADACNAVAARHGA